MSKNSPLSGIKLPSQDNALNKKNKRMGRKPKKEVIDKSVPTPRSYRLSHHELDILSDKAEDISQYIGKKVKITDVLVLRAIIRLSNEISNEEIIEKIKEIRMEI